MTEPPLTCTPGTTVAVAARLMRDADYGTLPVVTGRKVVGIVTDRDVCLALAETNRNALNIPVREVMTTEVFSTCVDDDVHDALAIMKFARVRRLPVCDGSGCLEGMLSVEDVVVRGLQDRAVDRDELIDALTHMYSRLPVLAQAGPGPNEFMPG
jgi:CBS domain-containing protein